MRNAEIAAHFDVLADLNELDGAIVHRVVAYRNAARAIRDAPRSVEELARAGRATELTGIGKTIAEKIDTLLAQGSLPQVERLMDKFPPGLVEITRIPGFGPKRARRVFEELGIASIDELRRAAEEQRLRAVPGFGAKAEENVLAALANDSHARARGRVLLSRALAIGEEISAALREHPACERAELAGSARRRAETCKDLDIVVAARDPLALVEAFRALPLLEVSSSGEAGARAVTHNGLPIDLRIVAPENFGNLLQHFTGSGAHNEALRTEAVRRGMHVSEYGVADDETGVTHACATEDEVYELLGLAPILPELRENRGELEAARAGRLPSSCTSTRCAATCTATPSPRTGARPWRRWPPQPASAATSSSPSPITRPPTASATTSPPTTCAATSSTSAPSTRGSATASDCSPARRSTSSRTARSTTRTSCSPSSTGWSRASTPRFGSRRRR